MTMKERMMAMIRGREVDRVPFVHYHNMVNPNEDAWRLIGRENLGILKWTAVHEFITPNCSFEIEAFTRNGLRGEKQVLRTPKGSLVQEALFVREQT